MTGRRRLLLVDDTDTILLFLRTILAGCGFEFATAKNGVEALDRARDFKPDLILMDVMMPVMDGTEACRRIKGDPDLKTIPVIMVTTRSDADNVEKCRFAGCDDYVFKPVRKLELVDKITRLINA